MNLEELLDESGVDVPDDVYESPELLEMVVSFRDDLEGVLDDVDPFLLFLKNANPDDIEEISIMIDERCDVLDNYDTASIISLFDQFDLDFKDFFTEIVSMIADFEKVISVLGYNWVIDSLKALGFYDMDDVRDFFRSLNYFHSYCDSVELIHRVVPRFGLQFNYDNISKASYLLGYSLGEGLLFLSELDGFPGISEHSRFYENLIRTEFGRSHYGVTDSDFLLILNLARDINIQSYDRLKDFTINMVSTYTTVYLEDFFNSDAPEDSAPKFSEFVSGIESINNPEVFEYIVGRYPENKTGLTYLLEDEEAKVNQIYSLEKIKYISCSIVPLILSKFDLDSSKLNDLVALILPLCSLYDGDLLDRTNKMILQLRKYNGHDLLDFVLYVLQERSFLPIQEEEGKRFSSYRSVYEYIIQNYSENQFLINDFSQILNGPLVYEWIFNYGDEALLLDESLVSKFGEDEVGHFILMNKA